MKKRRNEDAKRKKSAPAPTKTDLQNTEPKNAAFWLACPIEERLIIRLLTSDCSRKELDGIAGTTNSPEYVRRLRARGVRIVTNRAYGINQDHRHVWWGIYHLPVLEKQRIRHLLGW